MTSFLQWGVVRTSSNPPSWRATPYRLSAVADSIYSQLTFLVEVRSSICNRRTRHAMGRGTHVRWISDPATYKNWNTIKISNMYKIQEFCNHKYLHVSYLHILTIVCHVTSLLLYCLILISVVTIQKKEHNLKSAA
jgi:hypothetical protein